MIMATLLPIITLALPWPHRPDGSVVGGVPPSFDCAMRKAAYAYGKKLLPRHAAFEALYYALDLNSPKCHAALESEAEDAPAAPPHALPKDAIFVAPPDKASRRADAATADGSLAAPFRCIQQAADVAASRGVRTVVLRGGTFYLTRPIQLTPRHSGLRFRAHPAERPVVSGGVALTNLQWRAHNVSGGSNIWVADVDKSVGEVPGLQIDGVRATRARYPNLPGGIEVSPGYGAMVPSKSANWSAPNFAKYGNVTFYTDETSAHTRPDHTDQYWFEHYMIGVGGLCSVYDPPVSYWCSEHPSGGGAFAFRTPSGLVPLAGALPHLPYAKPQDAVFFVWRPYRWANWMFEVGAYDAQTANFTFGRGGNQGARGENYGGDWFVENVLEELDHPGEFYFDKDASRLYLFHNGTGAPPAHATVVAPRLRTLVNISGTQWTPVRDVTHSGIAFTATRYTYMDPHGVPSAGDWALDRVGAIFLQGTERVTLDNCTFERLDGNGVMVSGYNRDALINGSDFAYIGGNAIAAWGYTNETDTDPGRPGVKLENAPHAGIDGTDGEHPDGTTVLGCSAREVGLYEKQSSFYVQAKTARSNLSGNVFFNGPRAGINFNDGFGGGDDISHNLVFSTCRESGDHGPLNSWDRQPFVTSVRNGTPSVYMAWRHIHHNFFIDNYSPQENVDNDDGSAYYATHDNFFVYGANGMKNDFGGHDNHHYRNVYAYAGGAIGVCSQLVGHEDYFYDNKVVLTGTKVGGFRCVNEGRYAAVVVHDNQYYSWAPSNLTECGMKLAEWQAKGGDPGSSVGPYPADDVIIGWASALLGF